MTCLAALCLIGAIATAAALQDDPYAALNQHLHGDGYKCAVDGCQNPPVVRLNHWHLCRDCYDKMGLSA